MESQIKTEKIQLDDKGDWWTAYKIIKDKLVCSWSLSKHRAKKTIEVLDIVEENKKNTEECFN